MTFQDLKEAALAQPTTYRRELVKLLQASLPKRKAVPKFSIRTIFKTVKLFQEVPKLKIIALKKEVTNQLRLGGSIDFETALNIAIHNLLTDGRAIESPFGLIKELPEDFDLDRNKMTDQKVRQKVHYFMNDGQATFELITPESRFPPENGESIEKYWIFLFKSKTLSSSLFWVLVDRNGQKETFNYGFG